MSVLTHRIDRPARTLNYVGAGVQEYWLFERCTTLAGRYRQTVGATLLSFPEVLGAIVVWNWAVTPRIRRPRHNCFRDAEYGRQRRYPREQDPTRGQLLARKTAHLE